MKVPKRMNLTVVIAVMVVHDVGAFATFSSLSAFNTRTARANMGVGGVVEQKGVGMRTMMM